MNKSEIGVKYYLSLHSTRHSQEDINISNLNLGASSVHSPKQSRKSSVYDVNRLPSCMYKPIPKTFSESSKIKLNKVLRQHRLYNRRYQLVPNYIQSVRDNLKLERQLLGDPSELLTDIVKEQLKEASIHKAQVFCKKKKKRFEAPKPSLRKIEKENKLFIEPKRRPEMDKLRPLFYHANTLNDQLNLCGEQLCSDLDYEREKRAALQKSLRLTINNQQFCQHYKDFKKLTIPTRSVQRQVNVVTKPLRISIENPFEKNAFYQLHIRKDSPTFTEKFVQSFVENGRLTFNGYLSYHRIFVSRTATREELNNFVLKFFMHGCSNTDAIKVSEIKSCVRLLCQNVDRFGQLREFEDNLEGNLTKTLVGKLADEVTDKHLLLVDSFAQALKVSPNTTQVIFVLMFTHNPHQIEPPQ